MRTDERENVGYGQGVVNQANDGCISDGMERGKMMDVQLVKAKECMRGQAVNRAGQERCVAVVLG